MAAVDQRDSGCCDAGAEHGGDERDNKNPSGWCLKDVLHGVAPLLMEFASSA
jgi:hypothetical protein